MIEIKDLLPIGSVVILKEGTKPLMIIGVRAVQPQDDGTVKEFDYISVMYPEGFMGANFLYLFDQDKIDEVLFRGFESEERTEFLDSLEEFYKEQELANEETVEEIIIEE